MNDLISREAAIAESYDVMVDGEIFRVVQVETLYGLPSAQPLGLTCGGCRNVGTYDTDFPCSVCIRREKDYYEQE